MATKTQLSYGSKGDEVKELQNTLNSKGYSLDVDGIFGDKTKAAVQDYQQKNSLAVDGIVGNNTWGSLLAAAATPTTPATPTAPAATQLNTPDASKIYSDKDLSQYANGYTASEKVTAADQKAQDAWGKVENHGDFQYGKQDQLDAIYDQIMNRDKFSYDINGDALYQQYKDQYIKLGQMAMMDTMGQAAAMTGGYGSSYGQAVGQQAYNAQLEKLNDIVPELYQMALDKYQMEGQELYQKHGLLADDKSMEYGMWGDEYERLLGESQYLTDRADTEYAKDYGEYTDDRNYDTEQYWNETSFGYQQDRDAVADQQWQASFDESKRQWQASFDESVRQFEADYDLKVQQIQEDIRHNKITESQAQQQLDQAKAELEAQKAQAKAELDYKYAALNKSSSNSGSSSTTTTEKVGGNGEYAYSTQYYDSFKNFGAMDWIEYFNQVRLKEGPTVAKAEVQELLKKGVLPNEFAKAAIIGAQGSGNGR